MSYIRKEEILVSRKTYHLQEFDTLFLHLDHYLEEVWENLLQGLQIALIDKHKFVIQESYQEL